MLQNALSLSMQALAGAATFGVAIFLGGIGNTIGNILGNFSTDLLKGPLARDVVERIRNKKFSELNHDLQKAFLSSIWRALKSIKKVMIENGQGTHFGIEEEAFIKRLVKNTETYFSPESGNILTNESLLEFTSTRFIELERQGQPILLSEIKLEEKDNEIDSNDNYINKSFLQILLEENKAKLRPEFIAFFNERFTGMIHLYFTEYLKNEHNHEARFAFQRLLAEETISGIREILIIQKKTLQEIEALKKLGSIHEIGKLSDEAVTSLKQVLEEIKAPGFLEAKFDEAIERHLSLISRQLKSIEKTTSNTDRKVSEVKIDLSNALLFLKRYSNILIGIVLFLALALSAAYYHRHYSPFDVTLKFIGGNSETIANGMVSMEYGVKKETVEIGRDGLALFRQIPGQLRNDTVEVNLEGELKNQYEINSGFSRVVLSNNRIIKVKLSERTAAISRDIDKTATKPEKSDIPMKSNFADATVLKPAICDIEGAVYIDTVDLYERYITFFSSSNNSVSFTGKFQTETINGVMSVSGNSMVVKSGNVSGSLSLINDCKNIRGSLTTKTENINIEINYKRSE